MKKKSIFFIVFALCVTCFIACEKEKESDPDKPYVGQWKSNIYVTMTEQGDTVLQQMSFDFTNTTFSDAISRSTSVTDMTLNTLVTIRGSVANTEGTILDVSINTIELFNGATADRTQDENTFNIIFDGALGFLLSKDFEASYTLYSENDSMELSIPTKFMGGTITSILKLGKQ
jgi:hypothetical protein